MADDLTPTEVENLTKVMGDVMLSEYKTKESPAPYQPTGFRYESEPVAASRAQFMQLEGSYEPPLNPQELEQLRNVKLNVEVVLGSARMPLGEILKLRPGNVIALDKLAGEPVELLANGKLVARAEVVVVDEAFAIRILEIL